MGRAPSGRIVGEIDDSRGEGHGHLRPTGVLEFGCKCGNGGCTARVRITLAEYETLRTNPRRFVIVPRHEIPDEGKVVQTYDGYAVIEKIGL